jgi:hypothetical protein
LKIIEHEDLVELIPITGIRANFKFKLKEWRESLSSSTNQIVHNLISVAIDSPVAVLNSSTNQIVHSLTPVSTAIPTRIVLVNFNL